MNWFKRSSSKASSPCRMFSNSRKEHSDAGLGVLGREKRQNNLRVPDIIYTVTFLSEFQVSDTLLKPHKIE